MTPHPYTVDVMLHGAEPYPCVVCGKWRQDPIHAHNAEKVGHRKAALRHHCRLAIETVHPRFRWLEAGGAYSVVLTVNSGYE